MDLRPHIEKFARRFAEVEAALSDPRTFDNPQRAQELGKEYAGKVKVRKLNTDENPEVAGRYQVMSIPTILFFKNGQVVEKLVGARPKRQFKEMIDSLLAQPAGSA